jgi:hypothetical protein
VKTLAGHLKPHKVVRMQDLRLPKFDKTGASNLLIVLVFDNDNVKYNIILSTNLLSKTGFKSNCSEGTWNGLITPSHFVYLEELDSNEFDVMEHMLHIQLKDEIFGED